MSMSAKSTSLADPLRGLRMTTGPTGGRFDRAASRYSRRRGKVEHVRKPIGKRLRFEVFKRDLFTCQYCGRKPPEVVLEIDHIDPVANGGDNSELNLITACENCNGGKAANLLGNIRPSPDMDFLYMEMQQSIAEARRYLAAKSEFDALQDEIVDGFLSDWGYIFRYVYLPQASVFEIMLRDHSAEEIRRAMGAAGAKHNKHGSDLRRGEDIIRYMWGCLRRMSTEREP